MESGLPSEVNSVVTTSQTCYNSLNYLLKTIIQIVVNGAIPSFEGLPKYRKIVVMLEKLPYSKLVEKAVIEMIQGGVPIRQIITSIQHLNDAPRSLSTLYKHYGPAMEAERTRINGAVGKRVIDQALYGDVQDGITWKSQELFLRSKGGWSPQNTTNEVDQEIDPELDVSAADQLMNMLGFDTDEPEEENNG